MRKTVKYNHDKNAGNQPIQLKFLFVVIKVSILKQKTDQADSRNTKEKKWMKTLRFDGIYQEIIQTLLVFFLIIKSSRDLGIWCYSLFYAIAPNYKNNYLLNYNTFLLNPQFSAKTSKKENNKNL